MTTARLSLLRYILYFFLELGVEKTPTFNLSIKRMEILWWCWTSFPVWRVSSLFNLQQVHGKLNQTLATCGRHKAGFFLLLFFCEYMEGPKKLKILSTFSFILPLQKQFWFLLILRTSSAEACHKKNFA